MLVCGVTFGRCHCGVAGSDGHMMRGLALKAAAFVTLEAKKTIPSRRGEGGISQTCARGPENGNNRDTILMNTNRGQYPRSLRVLVIVALRFVPEETPKSLWMHFK